MRYLKLFETLTERNDWRAMIQEMAKDTLIDLIDQNFITEFVDETLNFYLDAEDYGFLWEDIKDHFTKFIELLILEGEEVDQITIYYKSTSFISHMEPEQIINGELPSDKFSRHRYRIQTDYITTEELDEIRLISIHFNK